jgi:hypothetical protein
MNTQIAQNPPHGYAARIKPVYAQKVRLRPAKPGKCTKTGQYKENTKISHKYS